MRSSHPTGRLNKEPGLLFRREFIPNLAGVIGYFGKMRKASFGLGGLFGGLGCDR